MLIFQAFASTRAQAPAGRVSQSPEVEAIVTRALDRSKSLSVRVAAYQSLFTLKPEDRERGLREVVLRGDEEFAAMALSQLISYRPANIVELANQQLPKWSGPAAAMVLQAVREQEDPALLEIPRSFLSTQLARYPKGLPEGRNASAVFIAAYILNRKGSSDDKGMVRKLILQNGSLRETWLLALDLDRNDDQEIALAKSVYSDVKAPDVTRVLAAAVAAKSDRMAAEFAVSEIAAFISRYQDQDAGVLMTKAMSNDSARNEYLAFQNRLTLVCVLQYFDSPEAQGLALSAAASKNLLIRVAAGLTASIRWPSHLLKAGQGSFSDDEYTKILAYLSLKHPQLLSEVMKMKLNAKAFSEALRRLHDQGAAGVFPTGTFLFNY